MAEEFDISERKAGIRNTVILLVLFVSVLVGLFINRVLTPRVLEPKELVSNGMVVFSLPREISPFSLVDQNDKTYTRDQLKGKWTFVFFGFTNCPDICPTTLAQFRQLEQKLKDTPYADSTRFVLVSLDPERDTPDKLKTYVEFFSPEFTGLTGEFLQLHKLATELNTAFRKVVTDHETGEYTVDHGGNVALLNPDGHYHGFYKPPLDVDKIFLTYRSERLRLK